MDKSIENTIVMNHHINVIDRKSIEITGIKRIISFDHEEFLLESTMGSIIIKGESLEIIKLDTHDGNISIKGKINAFSYIDNKKNKDESLLVKLFK